MRLLYWLIVVAGVLYFSLSLYTCVRPEWLGTIVSFLAFGFLGVTLVVTAILGLAKWRRLSRFWMMPTLLCLAFLLSARLTVRLGQRIKDQEFETRESEYLKVVDGVKNGTIPCGPSCNAKLTVFQTANLPPNVRVLIGARCDNGQVVVAFLANTDVPLLHEGYVFKGYDENSSCVTEAMRPENKWAYLRHVTERWYHFSDQPGL